MSASPVPAHITDLAWRALVAQQRLIHLGHQVGSALTTDNNRQRMLGEIPHALDNALLACRLFAKAAGEHLENEETRRG